MGVNKPLISTVQKQSKEVHTLHRMAKECTQIKLNKSDNRFLLNLCMYISIWFLLNWIKGITLI